jgi:starvation-inducible DNA-binding protein
MTHAKKKFSAQRIIMTDEQYANLMRVAFASEYSFYLKAQNFHWNVEGSLFPQYHEFFGNIYEEVGSSIDTFAEQLRALRIYAPAAFETLDELSEVECQESVPDGMQMTQELLADSDLMCEMFKAVYQAAEAMGDYGLANFLADRQDAHKKHSWMLRSTLK